MLIKAGAGRGKSVLLKHLLQNDLASSFRRLTLYFFFHSGSDLERSAVESMNAIIFQLLEQRPDMVRNVREGFPNVNASTRYHFELLCNIIQYCIHDFEGEVVLVLDGLDECEVLESPSGLSQRISVTTQADDHRQNLVKFFDWLGLLARTKTKKAHVKILCSTRTGADTAYHTSIAFKCQERNEIDLNAEVANSRSDLALYIKAKVCRPNIDEKKQEALASMLIELQKTSGSYLWLKLVFAILQRPKYETMSVDSFKNYLIQGEMDKVDKQFSALLPTEPEQQAMAKVIFSIILGSRRSLTTAELCGAVQAVVGEYIELDRPDVLADYCSAFVEINTTRRSNMSTTADEAPETKRTVDFFHDRARTFLLVTSQVPERLAPSSTTVSFLQSALSVMGVSQPKQIVEIRQRPTGFHHGFSNEYADGFMLETCVKYIQQKGLTGSIDNNLKFMQSHEKITDWISKYLKDNPFMVYAAIQWINHLPFDDKNRDLQARVSQQVHNLLDVTSQPFRTWFICNWRIWSPDMPMEMFFRQYVTAFITDNLQPSKKIRAEFKLEDPGVRGAWLWWTNNGDLSGLKNFMTMCNPDYERPQPSRQWISSYESTSMATEFRPEYERTTFD